MTVTTEPSIAIIHMADCSCKGTNKSYQCMLGNYGKHQGQTQCREKGLIKEAIFIWRN